MWGHFRWTLLPLFAAHALAQYPSSNTSCTRHYTVEDGDTCDIIGQKTFTSTYQIMALNLPQAGPDCYSLETGVQLCLGKYGNDCQLVHRARSDDTCNSIADQYGISVKTLKQNNPSLDCGQVYSGLMLCTTQGLIRPPASDSKLNVSDTNDQVQSAFVMPLGEAIKPANPVNTVAPSSAAPASASVSPSSAAPAESVSVSATTAAVKLASHRHSHHHGHH